MSRKWHNHGTRTLFANELRQIDRDVSTISSTFFAEIYLKAGEARPSGYVQCTDNQFSHLFSKEIGSQAK